ncbi:MAG: PmoA family protein [Candidatus Poribacteria bacterium]|jgi:hypothetical protein|nr:PmoA family protein [Candidatus Poribacteria bacterium]MDP6994771.1 PmoA family protein [Candidatus Poribacteria bacterium]
MQLSFAQETPHVMNIIAEGIGTISRYVWYPELHPHITCLLGPSRRNVLENQPADHLHHHGVCFSHGVVNDHLDFYLYRDKRNLGQINLVGDLHTETEDNVAILAHDSEWIAPDGRVLITDSRSYRWQTLKDGELYLDTTISLRPTDQQVVFHPTNESGMPLVRPADWLVASHGGVLTDSEGRCGEKEMFGKSARWIDETAETDGMLIGLAILDQPSNPVQAHWFSRDYGPLSPNYNYFTGPIELNVGDQLDLKYRIFVHAGAGDLDRINAEYDKFAKL